MERIFVLFVIVSCIFCLNLAPCDSQRPRTCKPTSPDILGPYYFPRPKDRQNLCLGDPRFRSLPRMKVHGHVYDADCTTALPNTRIEAWQADNSGTYASGMECSGFTVTDSNGRYTFWTIMPGKYSIDPRGISYRPAHIHFRVSTEGYNILVTQMYFRGDLHLGDQDSCSICASEQQDLIVETGYKCDWFWLWPHCYIDVNFDFVIQRGQNISVIGNGDALFNYIREG